jgi:hypothetical protein
VLIFAQLAKDWAPSLAESEMALLNRVSEEEPHDRLQPSLHWERQTSRGTLTWPQLDRHGLKGLKLNPVS